MTKSNSAQAQTMYSADQRLCESIDQDGTMPTLHRADRVLASSANGLDATDSGDADAVVLTKVARWAKDFLTKPHPALGRSGHVCPYVNAAIREQLFLLTVLRAAGSQQRQAEQVMRRLGRHFLQLDPKASRQAQLKTIVVLFPDLRKERASEIINDMHRRLKPFFLSRGMMLGEFFAESAKPGLHNPDFRPLRSDVPLLVIRTMMLTDIAFLSDRASFVTAFIHNFGAPGRTEVRSYLQRERDTLSDAQAVMLGEQIARYDAGERPCDTQVRSASPIEIENPRYSY